MTYSRSKNLTQSLSLDGQPLPDEDRQSLITEFNTIFGIPGTVAEAVQEDFIAGKIPFDEMVSYIRFCEYMIEVAQKHQGIFNG